MKSFFRRCYAALILIIAGTLIFLLPRGYSFIGLCLVFAGIATVVLKLLDDISGARGGKGAKTVKKLISVCLIAGIFLFAGTEAYIIADAVRAKPDNPEFIIVPGAGIYGTNPSRSLAARLNSAAEAARDYPDAVIIVSGGQGPDEIVTEASVMEAWLVSCGIRPGRIIREEDSGNTGENLSNCAGIIAEHSESASPRICIVTENYHITRCRLQAGRAGLEVSAKGAYNGLPVMTLNYYIREAAGVWYYILFR